MGNTMILFESDWEDERFQHAIVDVECPNKSFLQYALLLKEMGVKNYKWPLALLNPDLKGKDPFNPNLSQEEALMFGEEFKLNPWAFFRIAARIPGSTLENPIYFKANRSNMAVYWLYFNHVNVCLEQIRQTGKTHGVCQLDSYLMNIGSKGGRTTLVTKDEGLRTKTMTEIKSIQDLLPPYLKQHSKTDVGNTEQIKVKSMDNEYAGLIARNDPVAADKTGRGLTTENFRADEFAYLFFLHIVIPAAMPGTTAARERAELIGNPYGNIFMSTAGKRDDRDGAYAYEYFHSGAPWTEFFFDSKDQIELHKAIRTASRDGKYLRVHAVFSHRQLGYTDEWLRNTAIETSSVGEQFQRDYLNIWTSGSQNSPFTVEQSKLIRESQKEIQYAEISKYGQIVTRWYKREEDIQRILLRDHTVVAVDTSDAMGKDEIAVHFRHLQTGETLGTCGINEMNLITVSNFLVYILQSYPKMTMIIERRNQAATIVDYMHKQLILAGIDPFRRMYNTVVQDHMEFPDRYKEILNPRNVNNEQFLAQFKKFFGFITSGSGTTSRSELYGTTLQQAVKYTGTMVYDKPTIDQLLSLIITNGRVDHPKGGHDDMCVAWLLSYWFMTHGRNLQHYGIPQNYVLSNNAVVNSTANKEEMIQIEYNRRAKEHIESLVNYIRQEKDPYVIERVIFEIENVKNSLGPQSELAVTVDDMLNTIKKERRSNFYGKRSMFG